MTEKLTDEELRQCRVAVDDAFIGSDDYDIELEGKLLVRLLDEHAAIRDEARDLRAALAEFETTLEQERQRVEALQAKLKEARAENEALHSENSVQRVEVEASRVAVAEATQAVLDAAAAVTIESVRAELGRAGGIDVMPSEPKVVSTP